MLSRSIRKVIALLFMFLGSAFVSKLVDITPLIGSPQIDYPGFDFKLPFWPQLAISWILIGCGGGLVAALAMVAWRDNRTTPPSRANLALIWVVWFCVLAGLSLVGFLAWGTMGPLHVQQPIFRFALVDGAISATVITSAYWLASRLLSGPAYPAHALVRGAICLAAWCSIALSLVIVVAVTTGLPSISMVNSYWPLAIIMAAPASLLIALMPFSTRLAPP